MIMGQNKCKKYFTKAAEKVCIALFYSIKMNNFIICWWILISFVDQLFDTQLHDITENRMVTPNKGTVRTEYIYLSKHCNCLISMTMQGSLF